MQLETILDSRSEYILKELVEGVAISVDDSDLRVLDQDVGQAVYAIWSDSRQSIVALAFEKAEWSSSDANDWVTKMKEEGDKAKTAGEGDIAAESFDLVRERVRDALETALRGSVSSPEVDARPEYDPIPWVRDIGPNRVVFEYHGKTYAAHYAMEEDGVRISDVTEVDPGWVAPDGSVIELSEPLYAFWGSLGDGEDVDEDDGLIWKEILHPGKWFKSNTGKELEVTDHIIQECFRAFADGYPKYISVPADHHWLQTHGIVPPEQNRGFVKKLKLKDDSLYAGFSFTNKDTERGVLDGSIADVSAYLQPNVHHNATGEHYDWALRHVLLTNNPLVPDLAQWGVIAADADDGDGRQIFNHVQKEGVMPHEDVHTEEGAPEELTLTGAAATEYAHLRELGFSSAQLLALAEQATGLQAMGISVDDLVTQAKAMRVKARQMEIATITKALEGIDEHPAVVQVAGFRHQPVVVEAVAKALSEGVEALALSADDEGKTTVDAVILGVVNAIPETGRLPIAADESARKDHNAARDEGDAGEDVDPEKVDQFLQEIGQA